MKSMFKICDNKLVIICALISFMVPAVMYANYVINHMYIYGFGIYDVGWFTFMTTHSDAFPVQNPPVMGGSFFRIHFTVFFNITSLLHKYIFPSVSAPVYFAAFIGFCYGLISFSMFIASNHLINNMTQLKVVVIMLLSIVTAFNAQALSLIGSPHIEIAIPAFLILFVALYFTEHKKLSYLVFLMLLMIREDSGFHLFAILSALITFLAISKKTFKCINKDLFVIGLLALLYSIAAVYVQRQYFDGGHAFARVYTGTPAYAHINPEYLFKKFEFIKQNRMYLYVPMIVTVLCSVLTRSIYLMVGLLAIMPWVILSFFAAAKMTSSFSNYYAFPFIIMLCWPILSVLIEKAFTKNRTNSLFLIITLTVLIPLLSTALYVKNAKNNTDQKPWQKISFNHAKIISATQKATQIIEDNRRQFGKILFDEPLSVLMIASLKKDEYGYLHRFSKEQIDNVDTVFWNAKNVKSNIDFNSLISKKDFPYYYRINDTNILIASRFNFVISSMNPYTKLSL